MFALRASASGSTVAQLETAHVLENMPRAPPYQVCLAFSQIADSIGKYKGLKTFELSFLNAYRKFILELRPPPPRVHGRPSRRIHSKFRNAKTMEAIADALKQKPLKSTDKSVEQDIRRALMEHGVQGLLLQSAGELEQKLSAVQGEVEQKLSQLKVSSPKEDGNADDDAEDEATEVLLYYEGQISRLLLETNLSLEADIANLKKDAYVKTTTDMFLGVARGLAFLDSDRVLGAVVGMVSTIVRPGSIPLDAFQVNVRAGNAAASQTTGAPSPLLVHTPEGSV